MDDNKVSRTDVKESQRNRLVESLASRRTESKSDVTIVAGDKELYAHKLVLEASSQYFVTALEGSEDGNNFTTDEVEPEIIEVVLDYLYLGELVNLTDVAVIRKVMEACVLMDLQDLFEYCVAILVESLNSSNFVEIWHAAAFFNDKDLLMKTHVYLFHNADELINTDKFLESPYEEIVDLLNYSMAKLPTFDNMFRAMVNWIRHDLENREEHTKELFALVKPTQLSRPFYKSMLADKELMSCSTVIADSMNELGIAVFVFTPLLSSPSEIKIKTFLPKVSHKSVKITIFCENKIEDYYDGSTNKMLRRVKPHCLMQQFDLNNMAWKPTDKICFSSFRGATIFQHKRQLYFIGGTLDSVYAIFDFKSSSIEYIHCNSFINRVDAGVCFFRGYLYLIGGHNNEGTLSSCFRVKPRSTPWVEVAALKFPRGAPRVAATSQYIFVVGGGQTGDRSSRVIEYLYETKDDGIEVGYVYIRNVPRNLPIYSIVSGETLFGFYIFENELVRIWLDHKTWNWNAKAYPLGPLSMTNFDQVCSEPGGRSLLFVSTITKGLRLPTHAWDPETGIWTMLPPAIGKCELPDAERLPYIFTIDI